MNQSITNHSFDEVQWTEDQINRFGPIVGGEALRILLGFRTYHAFQKARLHSELDIAVFRLSGRQGHFAMTAEACAWLVAQRKSALAARVKEDGSEINEKCKETHP